MRIATAVLAGMEVLLVGAWGVRVCAQEQMPYEVKKLEAMETDLGNGVKMQFVLIPAGKFMMGSETTMPGHHGDESPYHEVTLTKPFWMGIYQVTQKQYETVTGKNPSHTVGADRPVEFMSWLAAQEFCKKASAKTGKTFRLPTEAEWEYACRAGTTTPWSFGDDPKYLGYYAWYNGNSGGDHHPVGQKRPNPWGLYDMHGNVWELVFDRYSAKYNPANAVDPMGPSELIAIRVMRGGSYNYASDNCTSYRRLPIGETIILWETGFRVVVDK